MGSFPVVAIGPLEYALGSSGSRRVYIRSASDETVYRSADGGATFTDVPNPSGFANLTSLDVLSIPGGNDIVWVGDNSPKIAKSTDGGGSFTVYDLTSIWPTGAVVQIVVIDADTVIAGNSTHLTTLAVTTNGGSSWSSLSPSDLRIPVSALQGGAKMWSGSDANNATRKHRFDLDGSGGETFIHSSPTLIACSAASDTLAFVYGDNDGRLLKIDGTTVSAIQPGSSLEGAGAGFYIAAAAPPDGSYYLAWIADNAGSGATDGEIWRSDDGGSSWTNVASDPGLQNQGGTFEFDPMMCLDPNDPSVAYVIANDGSGDGFLWTSMDSGQTWSSATPIPGVGQMSHIRAASG